jgi:hypothetical protein
MKTSALLIILFLFSIISAEAQVKSDTVGISVNIKPGSNYAIIDVTIRPHGLPGNANFVMTLYPDKPRYSYGTRSWNGTEDNIIYSFSISDLKPDTTYLLQFIAYDYEARNSLGDKIFEVKTKPKPKSEVASRRKKRK